MFINQYSKRQFVMLLIVFYSFFEYFSYFLQPRNVNEVKSIKLFLLASSLSSKQHRTSSSKQYYNSKFRSQRSWNSSLMQISKHSEVIFYVFSILKIKLTNIKNEFYASSGNSAWFIKIENIQMETRVFTIF